MLQERELKSTLESKQLVVETLEKKLNEATYCGNVASGTIFLIMLEKIIITIE